MFWKPIGTALLILATLVSTAHSAPPVIIAHRGASGYLPEHTLEAVSLAFGMGADFIEQDVVLSKDGVPVVLHDVHIDTVTDVASKFPNRTRTDGRFYAIDFDLHELRMLLVNERVDAKSGKPVFGKRFPHAKSRFRIATLAEEIELIQGLNLSSGRDVGIYPEVKQPAWHREQGKDISRIVLKTLTKYGYRTSADRCFLQCFEADELQRIRNELGTDLRLIQLLSSQQARLLTTNGLKEIATYAQGIGPSLSLVFNFGDTITQTGLAKRAQEHGLLIHPYTFRVDGLPEGVGSFDDLVELFATRAKVDGFFTDFPDRCRAALK